MEIVWIIALLGAGFSFYIAEKKYRNKYLWGFFGFLFPLPVILILLFLGKSKEGEKEALYRG